MRKLSLRNRSGQGAAKPDPPSVPAPAADYETSSARTRIPDVVPAGWLDQMLVAALDLPIFSGELAVVEALVDAVAAVVPGYAVGACFVPQTPPGGPMPKQQIVVKRLPSGANEVPTGIDPTRIFPGIAREYVALIPGGKPVSTLHVASNEDDLDRKRSATVHLIERAAMLLGNALAHARSITLLHGELHAARAFEQRMLEVDKLANFGQIAAGVVHELNNPLTSIVAYSEYLIRKALGGSARDAEDVERLHRIGEAATRMLRFTRDLVSYARPSSSVTGTIVLHDVIDQAIAFCDHVLSTAGVQIERNYGSDVFMVRAVGEQLVQVFVNLLTNASQAAPVRDGRVVVTTALAEGEDGTTRATVVVEDNGSGIAPDHLPQVFVPFFTTRRERQGTGLGLSIVKNVLESHDGAIRVESEIDRGTRFVIELPVG